MKLVTYLQYTKQITRRDFAQMIAEQVIRVNGALIKHFDTEVALGDKLAIHISPTETYEEVIHQPRRIINKLVLFHKPKGLVVSKDDPDNKTIYSILPAHWLKTYRYIGRLDKDSSGLLLLTNNPRLVDYYESPQNKILKVYEVQIDKPLRTAHALKATKGIWVTEDGYKAAEDFEGHAELLKCVHISCQTDGKGKHMAHIVLDEWKKRHIRRLLQALDYRVLSLVRTKVGKWTLGNMKAGTRRIETLSGKDLPKDFHKDNYVAQ